MSPPHHCLHHLLHPFNHNHLHAVASGKVRLRYHYLIIDRAFCLLNGLDTSKIEFESRIYDERVGKHIDELIEAYAIPENDPYRPLLIRTVVLRLIYILARDHGRPEEWVEGDRSLSYVKNAIAYIHSSYDKDFSLDDAADFVGINKCYLSREFHKYTGYPFVAYVNRTRCKAASELLKDGRFAISDVAARCGFKNKSYFAKNFKRYIGMLPGEYRANAK